MPELGKSQLLNPEGLSKIDPDGYCTYIITWELTKNFVHVPHATCHTHYKIFQTPRALEVS